MKKILIPLFTLPFLLAACVISPVSEQSATPVPAQRVYAFATEPQSEHGTLIVTRDSGTHAFVESFTVSINGTEAARFRPGERIALYIPTGDNIVAVNSNFGESESREINIKPGQVKHYRISYDTAVRFGPVSQ